MQLKGKRIIVIGGASGIGAGTVRAYVREGAIVSALDINDANGEAVVREADVQGGPDGGKATYYHCDIADQRQVTEVFAKAEAAMGGLDVLAHVAGIEFSTPAEDFSPESLQTMWAGAGIGDIVRHADAAHGIGFFQAFRRELEPLSVGFRHQCLQYRAGWNVVDGDAQRTQLLSE